MDESCWDPVRGPVNAERADASLADTGQVFAALARSTASATTLTCLGGPITALAQLVDETGTQLIAIGSATGQLELFSFE